MTSATFTFPVYRLAKILRRPGGKTIAAALGEAEEGLAGLQVPCLEAIDKALASMSVGLETLNKDKRADASLALYKEVNAVIGLATAAGYPEMDRAAYSLCDLLDRMQESNCLDIEAIRVHVQALHLLRQPEALGGEASVRRILLGLKQVRDKVINRIPASANISAISN